jgi:hypothetical protein
MARTQRNIGRTADRDTDTLAARIALTTPLPHTPVHRRNWLRTTLMLGIVAVVCTGVAMAGRYAGAQRNDDLAGISEELIAAIAAADFDKALSVCAESPQGEHILRAERRRVFGTTAGAASFDPNARAMRRQTLEDLHADLSAAGIDWTAVEPLAFAGVRARFLQASLMKAPASMVWGHAYFRDSGRLYALEVTAWECGGQYVIADIWDWAPVSIPPGQVESFAKDRTRERIRAQQDTPDDFKLMRPRRVYLPL